MDTKLCSKCKEVKPITEFWKRKKSPDGLNYQCKICVKEAVKAFEEKHPNRRKRYEKKYRSRNKVKIRRMGREWAAQKRRQEGRKPRPKRQKDQKPLGRQLDTEPIKIVLEDWVVKGNEVSKLNGRKSNLEKYANQILSGRIKVVSEDVVDKILFCMNEEHRWNELYPVNEER